ncbi:MAG: leucine-rich repeat domain-containing protein, partial [Victivallales bacterium]|nr:leucine-rich repeat domain-containing protein [Victivallales bacterium]
GMDAEQLVRIVEEDGLSFLINNGEAMLCAADEAMVNAVIPAAIEDVPVTSINEWAFQNMPNLESVSIPDTVTDDLGEWIFDGSSKLQVVDIAEENPLYASLDGIVYTADFTTLIFYPRGREDATFVVERVEAIDEFAFEGATALTGVTILDSVVTIYTCAFYGCTSLHSLTVGEGVDYIALDAFDECDALATVYTDNLYVIDWFTEHRPDVELLSLPRVTENGFTYRVLNGEATLIGVEDDDVEEIVIPTTVEDYPVIAIGDTAFDECENLKTVYTDNEIAERWFAENMPEVDVRHIAGVVVDCALQPGWNLITPTLALDDDSVAKLLDADAMVFDSANSTYRRASAVDIVPGTALWIFALASLEMELRGDLVFGWKLQVMPGWNLVGAVNDVAKEELPENVESVWEWTGSKFIECESMKQGKAYWVFGK